MRRFLDWTAAQAAGPNQSTNRRNSSTSIQSQHSLSSNSSRHKATNSTKDVEIQLLTKLLHEIKYFQASSSPLPSAAGSQIQQEFIDKVHKTLPLFLSVFGTGLSSLSGSTFMLTEPSAGSYVSSNEQLDNLFSDSTTVSSKPNSPLPPRSPQMERFPDLLPFAYTIARLFVSEVRQRASNKHAEEASLAIMQFLGHKLQNLQEADDKEDDVKDPREFSSTDNSLQGWNFLLSLNTLALSQNPQIIQLLCDASLPSTLIKCLYLFFDSPTLLPESNSTHEQETSKKSSELIADEHSTCGSPLVKAFTQLLIQLCSHQSAIDELIKKDDLRLLLGIASSQCSSHNREWRKTAFRTMIAISKNMRDNFMYLEQNLSLQIYVENMHRFYSLGLVNIEELVEMNKTLIEFLYNLDVNNRNQPRSITPLIDQFKSSRVMELIEEILFKLDDTIIQENQGHDIDKANVDETQNVTIPSELTYSIDDCRRLGRKLIQIITLMAKINICQESMSSITTLKPLTMSRFDMLDQFKMPKPSARNCILNFEALRFLKMSWSKCQDSHLVEAVLDTTIALFNDDKYNYFIFESQQLLVYYMTSHNFTSLPFRVKQKLFKFLEFIIIETNYIPCLELGTLGTIIKRSTSDVDLILGLRTLIATLRFDFKFGDIFRDIGLLEVITDLLIKTMQNDSISRNGNTLESLHLLLEASQHLLSGPNNLNCTQFNESGAARHVFHCLSKPKFFHLFIPSHSSSSDDSHHCGPQSQANTPPVSCPLKAQPQNNSQFSRYWIDNSSRHILNKPPAKQLQKIAFSIIRQLILSTAGDEHLANLLGLLARNWDDLKAIAESGADDEMVTAEATPNGSHCKLAYLVSQEINLKICILKSLIIILKDSHRCRTLFRKTGGFIYIVSALATLESSLLPEAQKIVEDELSLPRILSKVHSRKIWRLIKNSLMTIVVAVRSEPANLRTFSDDVIIKFNEVLRRLGCFDCNQRALPSSNWSATVPSDKFITFKSIFLAPPTRDLSTITRDDTKASEACCQLFRFLYDMSLDMGDGTAELELELDRQGHMSRIITSNRASQQTHATSKSISFDQDFGVLQEPNLFKRRSQLQMAPKRPPSLDLNSKVPNKAILTFPCFIITILDLIPSSCDTDLIEFMCLVLKSLFKHERNQQMLCESEMISKLIGSGWQPAMINQNHHLHDICESMFVKLARQAISAKELRTFIRLGSPLRCKNLDEVKISENKDGEITCDLLDTQKIQSKIPFGKIETLVAMIGDDKLDPQPPFVEFDMSFEGLSSIFMPSIAPINAKNLPPSSSSFLTSILDVHTNEKNGILGGVGSVERTFPPVSGLTLSTWICIEKFPARSSDKNHNLRLFTIYRGSAATGKEYSCFRIQISALDRSLLVSTQESLLFDNENRNDLDKDSDFNVHIRTPELILEGKWHHIVTSISRPSSKQSILSIYVDGVQVHAQRICYINSHVGINNSAPLGASGSPANANLTAAAFVNAFIGSLPLYRHQLNTRWKQGPCHLIEESFSPQQVAIIHALGPNYIGNLQNPIKLSELAKPKFDRQSEIDSSRYQRPDHESESSKAHKPLTYQRSAASVSSSAQSRAAPLTRVSSSNFAMSRSNHHNQSVAAHQQFHPPEDRIIMGLDVRATSLMTLSRMRRIYTRFDCRQVSRILGLSSPSENSTPVLVLHNTSIHLNGPSRGVGAITMGYNHIRVFVPSPTHTTLFNLGGSYILLGLVAQAQTLESLLISLRALVYALKRNSNLQSQMDNINGYQFLSVLFWRKKHLLNEDVLKLTFSLITSSRTVSSRNYDFVVHAIQQTSALRELICETFDLWLQKDMILSVLEFIYELISSSNHDGGEALALQLNNTRSRNLKCLREMDLLPRMLRLLPQYDSQQIEEVTKDSSIKTILETDESRSTMKTSYSLSYDSKAIYLIKQTVFELLNRTPRQSDLLYFGQFLASLLPRERVERSPQTISLRNILLKSLLQMMTKNKQDEVNMAMQEEIVKILGFDWFMLFISDSILDHETLTVGFLNMMILLSNDELYSNFKNNSTANGGWLKEPTFPTIDKKFSIQLLSINVGVLFGLSGKRKSIRQEVLDAPNLYLLGNCLRNLVKLPRIYLMIFLTMLGRLAKLDTSVLDLIQAFDSLSLDSLCDSLVGNTHHKRRQTLAGTELKCHELVVSLIYMIREIMHDDHLNAKGTSDQSAGLEPQKNYPTEIARFLMYLYNNNQEFQKYCRSDIELIDSICKSLMLPRDKMGYSEQTDDTTSSKRKEKPMRQMSKHPAAKEILELARLIIIDKMIEADEMTAAEINPSQQLSSFDRFTSSLDESAEVQGELIDMLMRQSLLMIDSTSRQNSIKTIESSKNAVQFQLLLTNSILVSQIVVDKIWQGKLYNDNMNQISHFIDHQLCLAEQVFKFNELLPKHHPPYAFIMQRVLNRLLLFALSRPLKHISERMTLLDILKKIYDNRTIIISNHMHSAKSDEFFVCLVYCLMRIIEENNVQVDSSSQTLAQNSFLERQSSLIERQFGNPSSQSSPTRDTPIGQNSASLMVVSMARRVWDSVYQSKKAILSEAFDVSMSLPAFTLDTSLDLIQMKPNIVNVCERHWSTFVDSESKPKRRLQAKPIEQVSQGSNVASSAVNLLSGRLTKVVNAANFVSRVVGATAGSVASNVSLVGDNLGQNRIKRESSTRSSVDSRQLNSNGNPANQSSGVSQASGGSGAPVQGTHPAQGLNQRHTNSSTTEPGSQFTPAYIDKAQLESAFKAHISLVDDYINSQSSQRNHKFALHKYLCDEWRDIESEILLRERAIFGPDYGSKLDKWCLDLTEGPRRMRKKMMRNTEQFFKNYPYRPEDDGADSKSLRYKPPMSNDSHDYYMKNRCIEHHLLEVCDEPIKSYPAITKRTQDDVYDAENHEEEACGEHKLEGSSPTQSTCQASCVEKLVVAMSSASNDETSTAATDDPNKELASFTAAKSPSISVTKTPLSITSEGDSKPSRDRAHSSVESIASNCNRLSTCAPSSPRLSNIDADDGDTASFVDFSPEIEAETRSAGESENIDSLSVLRLLEKNERISHMFRCSRVQGLDTYEGLLLFGREHFYLIDGFTLLKTREIKDIDSLPPDAHDPIIPNSTPNILAHSKKTCSKFSFDSIVEVHKRRYLLQPISLEIFSFDGRNTLLVFPRNIRNKVYTRLMAVATQLNSNSHESLAGQKSTVSVEGGSGLLSNLIGETSVTQRWVRGELSNFQYLMNLNTIAGRSYNDLMQYPIFPWILADYTSDNLDLTKASTFRDLSRPVGAQTSERLEQFKRRYVEWDDTETPPYHYGTFYSSAMIVASYMVRMEPFTQHFLRLQGGHFDLADRMFHSIHDSWLSASKHNMADIKELVPEFFYLPEFLRNENKYDLGAKQSGMKLDDVVLPPWAKNDAREFIRLHRCALESDYVSAHLHEWIDLIFGYKQQGQAAVDAVNVFHHLFYEGNVDIYNTDIDPIKKNAVIGFINNFGQVPKQLFKKPHPTRKISASGMNISQPTMPLTPILPSLSASPSSGLAHRILTHHPELLRQTTTNLKELRGPVGQVVQVDRNIIAVEQNKLLIPPEYCRYIAWGHADRSLRLSLYDSEKPIFVWEGSENMSPNEILCCTIPNNRIMITGGTDSLITVWRIEKMRSFAPQFHLYGHVEPVTCLASSQAYSIIVSGSRDRVAIIWDLNRFTFVRQLGAGPGDKLVHCGPISAITINDSTGDIATCALSKLYLWTINGELLAQIDTVSATVQQSMNVSTGNLAQLHILSVCFSQFNEWDLDELIATGASDGTVALWSMRYTQVPLEEEEEEDDDDDDDDDDGKEDDQDEEDFDLNDGGGDEKADADAIESAAAAMVTKATTDALIKRQSSKQQELQEQKQRDIEITQRDDDEQVVAAGKTDASAGKRAEERPANIGSVAPQGADNVATAAIDEDENDDYPDGVGTNEAPEAGVSNNQATLLSSGVHSDPINIPRGRKRTDTMNSEWVKLSSTSSTASTNHTMAALSAATPMSSLGEQVSLIDLAQAGPSMHLPKEPASDGSVPPEESCDPSVAKSLLAPLSSTPKEAKNDQQDGSDKPQLTSPSSTASIRSSGKELDASKLNLLPMANDPSLLKFSKSDTSLVDSFVLLGGEAAGGQASQAGDQKLKKQQKQQHQHQNQTRGSTSEERVRPASSAGFVRPNRSDRKSAGREKSAPFNSTGALIVPSASSSASGALGQHPSRDKLKPNFRWARELYLRMILRRHNGKSAPLAVTSLAISKDHKTLYAGDCGGRITSWSMAS